MKALTIRQPWASLIVHGIKTIETRSWRTHYRGRIAVHAGATKPRTEWFRDFPHNAPMLPWFDLIPFADRHYRHWEDEDGWWDLGGHEWVGPLGAIVGTATLVDCLPIVGPDEEGVGDHIWHCPGDTWLTIWRDDPNSPGFLEDEPITDQLPYGDFTPGRWAWILDDAKPTTERCPACWGEGHCLTCGAYPGGERRGCAPIPAKGRPGLWGWTP